MRPTECSMKLPTSTITQVARVLDVVAIACGKQLRWLWCMTNGLMSHTM